tara:strand:+ start:221 stop:553 length:333 start_codon:yes stop_codon:yes gene_type:complete
MTHRVKALYHTLQDGRVVSVVYDVDNAKPAAWVHETPCCDERLLKEDIRENWSDIRSAWDSDDDVDTDLDFTSGQYNLDFTAVRVMSANEFLMESAQDRLYPELGDVVYK